MEENIFRKHDEYINTLLQIYFPVYCTHMPPSILQI
jgi:hypothetical protein